MLYELNTVEIESSVPMKIVEPQYFDLKEDDIENFLKSRLSEIVSEDQLMLIGQERKWKEEPDLLALDKDGILYIFELKRWQSEQENILQVMRYGQKFGRYTYQELENLAKRQQKLKGFLNEKHKEYFELEKEVPESDFNKDQKFVLVTNGMDQDTISAVNYWSKKGVKIKCSPYRIYDIDGKPYIQFDSYNPEDEILPEKTTQYFIVNTNKSYMPDAWKDMLNDCSEGKASAYYDRKNAVRRISTGAYIYLYQTSIGVIAKGVATSEYRKAEYDGDKNAEFYVPLRFEWALQEHTWDEKAVQAWEINEQLNSSHRFRGTVFAITKDMTSVIDSIAKRKRLCEQ